MFVNRSEKFMKHNNVCLKLFGFIFLFLLFAPQVEAQRDFEKFKAKKQSQFQKFRKDKIEDFEKFREKRNKKYAKFLKERWSSHEVRVPLVTPRIEPPKPVYAPENGRSKDVPSVEIPVTEVIVKEKPVSVVQIPEDISVDKSSENEQKTYFRTVNFYGTPIKCKVPENVTFRLSGIDEVSVGEAWDIFYDKGYDIILLSVNEAIKAYNLSDWGIFKLIEFISDDIFGENTNETCVLRAYLMSQANIDVRIGRTNAGLVVLVPITENIAGYSYLSFGGKKYYLFGNVGDGAVYTYNESFGEKSNSITLAIDALPKLDKDYVESKVISSKNYPALSFKTIVNRNLMDYYDDLPPVCNVSHYSSIRDADENTLLPLLEVLDNALDGKSEVESVNMILDLIQYGFDYKTDDEQFGREKYNYIEEDFYYSACDCEDRAVLFSVLTEIILERDVVLLEFPNHLSAAVCFSEPVDGDYIEYKGKKYYICDPTYIGANAGMMMPLPDVGKVTVYDAR